MLLVVTGENSSSANAPVALPLLLALSLSRANSLSNSSSSWSRCAVKLVELALDTNHAWPFDSRADDDIAAPARKSQSESFLSFADNVVRLNSSLVTSFRSFVPPAVVASDRGWFPTVRCVLDLLFGRMICCGFRR